jgi:EmrB/QacA subfamily drug resistance transporter
MVHDRVTIMELLSSARRRWVALVVVCIGQLMIVVDASIVNVALPAIQHDLHFSQSSLTWVINAYMISYGGFLLLAGRMGDLVGRKRVFLVGLVLFTLASAACGFADSQALLIVARFVQGFGGAVCAAVIVAIVATGFPRPAERATAMSVYTFTAVSGGTIGLLLGGVIVDSIDWHWIFFINVPIGIVTWVLGRALIEESEGIGLDQGVDVAGALLGTASLMLGVYAIVKTSDYGWGSAHTLGFGAGALALLVAFLVVEARVRNPMMPLRILRLRGLTGSSVVRGLTASGMFTTFFLGALYLEHVRGYDALQIGLAFLPTTLVVAILSSVVPGLTAMAAGLALLAGAGEHTAFFPTLFFAFALMGIGGGTSFMPLLHIAMGDVPARDAGLASGIVNVSMWISASLGLAALGAIAADRTKTLAAAGHSATAALTGGYDLAFLIGAALVAVGVVVAIVVLPAGEREREREPDAEPALG